MVDCGGDCAVCIVEGPDENWVPDHEGADETQPAVDMAEDGTIALVWRTVSLDIRAMWRGDNPSDPFSVTATIQAESNPMVRIREGNEHEMLVAFLDPDPLDEPDLVLSQRDASGGETSPPTQVDTVNVVEPEAAGMDLLGNTLAFTWRAEERVWARRYDASSNSFVDNDDLVVAVLNANGACETAISGDGILYAWDNETGDFQFDPYIRHRTPNGSWSAEATAANADTGAIQHHPKVAALADGGYVVVWDGASQEDGASIGARILDETGAPTGDDILVNEILEGNQVHPNVTALRWGFAVAWQDTATSTIRMRRFLSDGTPRFDDESPWGSTPGLEARAPSLAANDEELVIVWSAMGSNDLDIVGVRVAY